MMMSKYKSQGKTLPWSYPSPQLLLLNPYLWSRKKRKLTFVENAETFLSFHLIKIRQEQ